MKNTMMMVLLFVSVTIYGQDFKTGKNLFKNNCAACHKMDKKLVGPALKDVVKNQGRDWTKEWIYNSQALIKSGDAHANEIYEEYNQMAMPAYNYLEDSDLESIVTYLEDFTKEEEAKAAAVVVSQPTGVSTTQSQSTPTYIWILVIVCVVLVALSLYVILLAMKTIAQHAARYQSINKHLMNRLGLDTKELEKEFDEYLDGEVNKKVEDKIKVIKKEINEKLNKFK